MGNPCTLGAGLIVTAIVQALLLCCFGVGFFPRYSEFITANLNDTLGHDTCSAVLLALTRLASFVALAMFFQGEAREAVHLFHQVAETASTGVGSLLVWVPVWQMIVAGFTLYLQGFVSLVFYIGKCDHWCVGERGDGLDAIDVLFNSVVLSFILQLDDQMWELLKRGPNSCSGPVLDWTWLFWPWEKMKSCWRTNSPFPTPTNRSNWLASLAGSWCSRCRSCITFILSGLGVHVFHMLAMGYSCILFVFMITAFHSLHDNNNNNAKNLATSLVVATVCFAAFQTLVGLPLQPLAVIGTCRFLSQPHTSAYEQWYLWTVNILVPILMMMFTLVLSTFLERKKLPCTLRKEGLALTNAICSLIWNSIVPDSVGLGIALMVSVLFPYCCTRIAPAAVTTAAPLQPGPKVVIYGSCIYLTLCSSSRPHGLLLQCSIVQGSSHWQHGQ
jgi:hypothetical protein